MKKLVFGFIAIATIMSSFNMVPINAEELEETEEFYYFENYSLTNEFAPDFSEEIIEADLNMHGEEVEKEIIIYDAELGIDHLDAYAEVINFNNRFKRGWENSGNISAKALRTLRLVHPSITWIQRNGIWSLSLVKSADYAAHASVNGYNRNSIFDLVQILFYNDYQWRRNYSSMKNQYTCHWSFARYKSPWNIEPHKSDKAWGTWVASSCN